jgi:hypothetical protein
MVGQTRSSDDRLVVSLAKNVSLTMIGYVGCVTLPAFGLSDQALLAR